MAVLKKSKLTGRVAALLSTPDRKAGLEKQPVQRLDMVFDGIVGDCHSSRIYKSDSRLLQQYPRGIPIANTRQVSIVSQEELAEVGQAMETGPLKPEWLGANLVTAGIPELTLLPPSTRMTRAGIAKHMLYQHKHGQEQR